MITQIQEESPFMHNEHDRMAREPLREYLNHIIDVAAERLVLGENNIKGHLFLSAVSAQIEAMEKGVDPDPLIAKAARDSATKCYGLLKARIKKPPSSVVDEADAGKVANGIGNGMAVGSGGGDGNGNGNGGIGMEFGTMEMDQEFAFEYLMPDTNMNFDIPESWLFEGLDEHHEW